MISVSVFFSIFKFFKRKFQVFKKHFWFSIFVSFYLLCFQILVFKVMDAFQKSGAASFDELLFRTKPASASILVPHEILRFSDRYREAKKSGDIRAGGTTMKEAPLWAPSGKNLTTPTQYMEIARAVKPAVVQLLSDIDFDYRQPLSKKRFEKAFKRSESWIEQQIESDSNLAKLVPVLFHSDPKILGPCNRLNNCGCTFLLCIQKCVPVIFNIKNF